MTETSVVLKQLTENIKFLEDKKKEIADEIAAVYSEAKSNGFSPAIIKKVVKASRDLDKHKAEMTELKIYCDAVQLNLFD